jgi:ABC-2 type transport system ATP-binding protein
MTRTHRPPAIWTQDLRREFHPHQGFFRKGAPMVAVDGVNLNVEAGTVFGLLGPNGAGKTTTIKMISTLLLPTSGQAAVAGYDVVRQEHEVRRRLGVLLGGDKGLYNKLPAVDNLRYFAALYGVPSRETEARVQELLEMTGLAHRQTERVEGFSRGMKQRIHLAKALIHNPDVVILDEPTIGLDPDAADQLRHVVRGLVPQRTVLLTTHYLAEADDLCDRIAIIDQGRIVAEDTPEGIKRLVGGGSVLEILVYGRPTSTTIDSMKRVSGIERIACRPGPDPDVSVIEIATGTDDWSADPLLRLLVAENYSIVEIRNRQVTLEEAFLSLTRRELAGKAGVRS